MCKFCDFKYDSNLDSLAIGEVIDKMCIVKNRERLSKEYQLYVLHEHEGFIYADMEIQFCPLCGVYLPYASCERRKDDEE